MAGIAGGRGPELFRPAASRGDEREAMTLADLGSDFIGWALGATMAALVTLSVRSARRLYYAKPLAAVWGLGSGPTEYNVVLPARVIPDDETKDPGWPWMPMGDAYAAAIIVQTLRSLHMGARVEIYASGEIPFEKKVRSHVICIGGPSFNQITAEFMEEMQVPLEYMMDDRSPGHPAMRAKSGAEFISDITVTDGGWQIVRSDWGAVVIGPNPYSETVQSDCRVFLVMGNGSQGTIAAARSLAALEYEPLGPAIRGYLRRLPLLRRQPHRQPYVREVAAGFRASAKCVFMLRSRVERGYVAYPHQAERVPWD